MRNQYLGMSHDAAFKMWRKKFDRQQWLLMISCPTKNQNEELRRLTVQLAQLEDVLDGWRNQRTLGI